MKKLKPWHLLAAAAGLAACILAVQAFLGLHLARLNWISKRFCGPPCFRLSRPAPYANADYFSKDFVLESLQFPILDPDSEGANVLPDFHGTWLNAAKGHRATAFKPVNVPLESLPTIYVFGDDAVEGTAVPDEWTIPSQLQRALGASVDVENFGYNNSIAAQVNKLRELPIKRGDTVVFCDGALDALEQMLMGRESFGRDENMVDILLSNFTGGQRTMIAVWAPFLNLMSGLPYFGSRVIGNDRASIFLDFMPQAFDSPEMTQTRLAHLEVSVRRAIEAANAFSRERGARFLHFFEPWLGSDGTLTSYEQDLAARPVLVPTAGIAALKAAIPIYAELNQKINAEGITSVNLAHVFADRPPGDEVYEVYLDTTRLNHLGNKAIAEQIAKAIRATPGA